MNIRRTFTFSLLLATGLTASALAQQTPNTKPVLATRETKTEKRPESTETEPPLVTVGWDQRWRNEEWNNIFDYRDAADDERAQNTFRQRLWAQAPLLHHTSVFYLRVLNQFTKQTKNGSETPAQLKLNSGEWIFDNLYLNFQKLPVKNLALTVGRQDLTFGEGFLVADGSAGDGPRTNYFNAVDFIYTHQKSTLDVIGILDPRQDRFLPQLHSQHTNLNEWDEQAIALYYRDRNVKGFDWDAYYFLKKEFRDYRAASNPLFQPDRHVNTLGTRVVKQLPQHISLTSEFAYQWGAQHANPTLNRPAENIRAWGGHVYVKKQFDRKLNPYLLAGYWALSGDDGKTTHTYEGFDPLFSRTPKYSGGYIWSLQAEKGAAYWSNIKMPQLEVGFTPVTPLTIKAVVFFMSAFHPCTTCENPTLFGLGTYRATMQHLVASYKFSDKLAGEFRYEKYDPGSFYATHSKGQYFRFDFNYSWKKALRLHKNI